MNDDEIFDPDGRINLHEAAPDDGHPGFVMADQLRGAVKHILGSKLEHRPADLHLDMDVRGFAADGSIDLSQILIDGKSHREWSPETVGEIFKVEAAISKAEQEGQKEKYLDPDANDFIKLDSD
jgi:hypothetical protein